MGRMKTSLLIVVFVVIVGIVIVLVPVAVAMSPSSDLALALALALVLALALALALAIAIALALALALVLVLALVLLLPPNYCLVGNVSGWGIRLCTPGGDSTIPYEVFWVFVIVDSSLKLFRACPLFLPPLGCGREVAFPAVPPN